MSRELTNYPKFPKSKRSTFTYWFWHWLAYNKVACKHHLWRPRYIFHDIEKPFLRLILPYEKVQKIHRTNAPHHLEYKHPEKRNWIDMWIDWEASQYTKETQSQGAVEYASSLVQSGECSIQDYYKFISAIRKEPSILNKYSS